jgi:hypothetical protein
VTPDSMRMTVPMVMNLVVLLPEVAEHPSLTLVVLFAIVVSTAIGWTKVKGGSAARRSERVTSLA